MTRRLSWFELAGSPANLTAGQKALKASRPFLRSVSPAGLAFNRRPNKPNNHRSFVTPVLHLDSYNEVFSGLHVTVYLVNKLVQVTGA